MSDRRRNTPKEIAEVALAYDAGKPIQCRSIDGRGPWTDGTENPSFNFYYYQHRVKPVALHLHMLYYGTQLRRTFSNAGDAQTELEYQLKLNDRYPHDPARNWKVVEFVEVLKTA